MSRKISTQPETRPCSSRIGAALSSIGRSVAVLANQHGVIRQPDDDPLAKRPRGRVLDRLAGVLVDDAEHVVERLAERRPAALQPVSLSATAFIYVTRPRRRW